MGQVADSEKNPSILLGDKLMSTKFNRGER